MIVQQENKFKVFPENFKLIMNSTLHEYKIYGSI